MKTFIGRHPVWTVLGAIAAIPIGYFVVMMPIAGFVVGGFWSGIFWLVIEFALISIPVIKIQKRRQRLYAEIAARADYEHNALGRGDLQTWMHGRYQPPYS